MKKIIEKYAAHLFLLAAAVGWALPVIAGTCSVTNLPTSGYITASSMNARYDQIESCINGDIGNSNWDASEPLQNSNLASPKSVFAVSQRLACNAGTSAFQFRVPVAATLTGASVRVDATGSYDYDVVAQVAGVTRVQFTGVSSSSTQTSTGGSHSVSTAQDVEIDVTQNTAGTCSGIDVVLFFTANHTS